jgi:hypothetical protein
MIDVSRTRQLVVVGALLAAALAAGCSSSPTGATARSDVAGDTSPGVISQHIAMTTPFTLQAGDVCTTGRVRITKVEPGGKLVGRLVVTDWGTRYQGPGQIGGDNDPSGERVTLRSLGGFGKAPFTQVCTGPDGLTAHHEFNVETKAKTPVASATGFKVTYNNGRTFFVPLSYGRCITGYTTEAGCTSFGE